jgi:hypothetical protein
MIAPYATATQEAVFIHCTIFENYSRFAGALQVPPSTTTRLPSVEVKNADRRRGAVAHSPHPKTKAIPIPIPRPKPGRRRRGAGPDEGTA